MNITLSSNGGTQPSGVQWDLVYSSGDLVPAGVTFFTTGATALAAGKQATCNIVAPGDVRCVVVGFNSSVIANGVLATVTFQISPGTTQASSPISFSSVVGTDPSSNSIAMTGTGATVTINQPAPGNPVLSNLTCSPASLTPPGSFSCTASLSAAATSSTSVTLSSNSPGVTVPPSVTIASGQTSASFTASAPSAVSVSASVTITASLNGNVRNFSLSVVATPGTQPAVSSLVCTPNSPTGGTSSYCVVYLASTAPSGGTAVTITSSNMYAAPPSLVVVPAGLSNASFTVATIAVTIPQTSTLSALSGNSTISTTLTVEPVTTGLSTLSCSPGTIGPAGTSNCTVSLTKAAPSGGLTIGLSSNSSAVSVPAAVVIAAGSNSALFTATAGAVTTDVTATLMASWNGQVTTYSLTVSSKAVLISLTCTPASVNAGNSSTCSVALSKGAPAGGLAIALASTNAKVTVPASVGVTAGATAASFPASVAANASNNDTATISATANSVTRTAILTITQAPPPPNTPALVCNPSTLLTPGTSSCLLTLGTAAPSTGLTVTLTSSSTSLTVPPSVNIAAGGTSATFTVTASTVASKTPVSVAASPVNVSQTLSLLPPTKTNLSITSISCSPQTLTGGGTSACQIALSGAAPAGGLNVLVSSSSTQVTVPQIVPVAQGSATGQFSAASTLIDHDESATLTANLSTSSSQTPLALVGIKPVAMACSPKSLASGSPVSCQVTLNSAQAANAIGLALASSNNHVSVPPSVSSQPGQATITFQANTSFVTANQTSTVSASYHAIAVQDSVTLTPAAPILKVPGRQSARPGKASTFTVSASDPAGLAVSISVWGLPPNSSFNPNTGVFTWVPDASQIGLHTVHFTGTNVALISATQDVIVDVGSDTPVILSLANAASYVNDGGCSPGAVASLLGAGFVNTTAKSADASPIPIQVNGVRVKANGDYLPVFYASAEQVNFQCPPLAPGEVLTLLVESNTGSSSPLASKMLYAAPGIFSIDGSGTGQGAILLANSNNIAMAHVDGIPSQPVKLGGAISIYATGLGPVQIAVPAGQPAPLHTLDPVRMPVDVLIAGSSAKVEFAGLAPGYTGLYQVNARVPSSATTGDAITIQIVVHLPDGSAVKSNAVTIAIAAN